MADINNSIGLDASQANASLDMLTRKLAQANAAMSQFSVTAGAGINTGFDRIGIDAQKAGQAGQRAFQQIDDGAKRSAESARGLQLTLGDVARIVQSQIIFGAISAIKQGFFEAAEAAQEFQLQIARIEAITEDGFTGSIREEIEALSIELGRGLGEVGTAAFEALQNDLGTAAETFKILREEAGDLALVTGGDLVQAVNALSSVYKSFEGTTEDLSNVSGQLFGTYEAGRITLSDLENFLGTIAPLGREAGVGLQDLLDGLATITLTGTNAAVATTQLRNVFNKLIKPTEDLTKVYQDLGVRGFKELEKQAGGLVPALQAITGAVDNDEQRVAKLFNTIRGNLGVLNVLTREGELFSETAERSALSADRLGESIGNLKSTDAFEATLQAAELGVIFTQVGDDALALKNAITGAFLSVIDSAGKAEFAMGAVTASIGGAIIATRLWGATFSSAILPISAFAASVGFGLLISKQIDLALEATKGFDNALDKMQSGSLQQVVVTLEKIDGEDIKQANAEFANTESVLNKVLEKATATGKAIEDAFNVDASRLRGAETNLLESFGDARQRILDGITKAIKDIDDAIAQGTANIASLQQAATDFNFERGLRSLDESQKVSARLSKTARLIQKSFEASANAGLSEESQKAAAATFKTAESNAKSTLAAADRLGDTTKIAQAEAGVRAIAEERIRLEQRLNELRQGTSQNLLDQQKTALEGLNATDRKNVAAAVEARKKLEDAIKKGVDSETLAGLDEDFRRQLQKALDGLDAFAEADIVKAFGFDKLAETAKNNLETGLSELQIDWDSALISLRDQLATADDLVIAAKIDAQIDEQAITVQLQRAIALANVGGGNSADQLKNTAQAVKETNQIQLDAANTLVTKSAVVKKNIFDAAILLKEASQFSSLDGNRGAAIGAKLAESGITAIDNISTASEGELIGLQGKVAGSLAELGKQSVGLLGDVSVGRADDIKKGLEAAFLAIDAQLEVVRAKGIFDPAVLEETNLILDKLNALSTEENVLNLDDSQVKTANRSLDSTKLKAASAAVSTASIGKAAGNANGSVRDLNSTTGLLSGSADSAVQAFNRLALAAKAAAQAARDAVNAGAGSFNAHGGIQHLAAGGQPTRGRDNIPTMLQQGEFVVGAKQTRSFLPELQAINSGSAPSGGASGGDTNITIGDVNVTSTSQLPSQTAREVGFAIKRELRRGNLN